MQDTHTGEDSDEKGEHLAGNSGFSELPSKEL